MAKRPTKVCFHEWRFVFKNRTSWRRCIYCGKYQKEVSPGVYLTAKA